MSHTPGPWHVGQSMESCDNVLGEYGQQIAVVGTLQTRYEDARLIAAAPDLLGVLDLISVDYADVLSPRDLAMCREVIAKATGGSNA